MIGPIVLKSESTAKTDVEVLGLQPSTGKTLVSTTHTAVKDDIFNWREQDDREQHYQESLNNNEPVYY